MGNGRKCYFPNDKEYVESCKKHESPQIFHRNEKIALVLL
ncbi:WSSV464 [White spot syndrome virus]|uniref:WSSV464 n=1 Tax=White spot syndrome virus TaxID=342409 RepID=A0A2I6SCE4_9VIRU|nr:WSSV464 [White spot syndrome virus]